MLEPADHFISTTKYYQTLGNRLNANSPSLRPYFSSYTLSRGIRLACMFSEVILKFNVTVDLVRHLA